MILQKLAPSEKVQGRWLLWLENGALLRVSEGEVADFALYAGKELSDRELAQLQQAARRSQIREKALDLLGYRALSRGELARKLTEREFSQEETQEVCDWLEDLGYLNDSRYAAQVCAHYAAKGYGERRLREELYRRQVPREYWEEALGSVGPTDDEVDAFLRKRFKGERPDPKELKRASDALLRRGFRYDQVREGLRRYGMEVEDTEP